MKTNARKRLITWCVFIVLFTASIGFVVHKAYRESFQIHVTACSKLPSFAGFTWMAKVSEESAGELLEMDKFAYEKFSKSFSEPVPVSVWSNGAGLYLSRVWKVGDGYLILTCGRDPLDLELLIRYEDEMPKMMGEPFAKKMNMTIITPEFLEDYEVLLFPSSVNSASSAPQR